MVTEVPGQLVDQIPRLFPILLAVRAVMAAGAVPESDPVHGDRQDPRMRTDKPGRRGGGRGRQIDTHSVGI